MVGVPRGPSGVGFVSGREDVLVSPVGRRAYCMGRVRGGVGGQNRSSVSHGDKEGLQLEAPAFRREVNGVNGPGPLTCWMT